MKEESIVVEALTFAIEHGMWTDYQRNLLGKGRNAAKLQDKAIKLLRDMFDGDRFDASHLKVQVSDLLADIDKIR